MAQLIDVAHRMLTTTGEVAAMKLQKMLYYAQAWSLVWDEAELFRAEIQAWAGGPVIPELYERHHGMARITTAIVPEASGACLTHRERETVDRVVEFYGVHSAQWLSELTHTEDPWIRARARAKARPSAFCREPISHADMIEYYGGLLTREDEQVCA